MRNFATLRKLKVNYLFGPSFNPKLTKYSPLFLNIILQNTANIVKVSFFKLIKKIFRMSAKFVDLSNQQADFYFNE